MKKMIVVCVINCFLFFTASAQSEKVPVAPPTCNCPGSSTCSASCAFSECCVCWNPNKSDGACGCYYGIAVCKTSAAGTTSFNSKDGEAGEIGNVRTVFKFTEFNIFIAHLKSGRIDTKGIEAAYSRLSARYGNPTGTRTIDGADLQTFADAYIKAMDALPAADKVKANNYIQSKQ